MLGKGVFLFIRPVWCPESFPFRIIVLSGVWEKVQTDKRRLPSCASMTNGRLQQQLLSVNSRDMPLLITVMEGGIHLPGTHFLHFPFTVASIVGDAKQLQDMFFWSNVYFQKCTSALWQLLFLLAGIWKTRLFSSRQYSLVFLETSESVVTTVYVNFTTLCTGFSSGKTEHSAQFRPALRALCCWRSNCVGGGTCEASEF